jgi:hypothetical protein
MAGTDEHELRHSVAFRVTEAEWRSLQLSAKKLGMSVPRMAKLRLFEATGLQAVGAKRSAYGHKPSRARQQSSRS